MSHTVFIHGKREKYEQYAAALEASGAKVLFSLNIADAGVCDALLLPGGNDIHPAYYGEEDLGLSKLEPERDVPEFALADAFVRTGKPILGICRGAQVLAVALGGTLRQHIERHDGLPNGADRIHETWTAGILTSLYGPSCSVNSWHHQAVEQLPPECRILQLAGDGVIEAFDHRTLPILAVQWHPERLCGRFARPDAVDGLLIFRHFLSLCKEAP